MNGRRTWQRALVAVLLASTVTAGPVAHAHDAGVFDCSMVLNLAAGSGNTHCSGIFSGLTDRGTHTAGLDIFLDYDEPQCPVIGQATGTVFLDGEYFADIAYVRLGTTALPILTGGHTGAAPAQFLLDSADLAPGYCADTEVTVTLTGTLFAITS